MRVDYLLAHAGIRGHTIWSCREKGGLQCTLRVTLENRSCVNGHRDRRLWNDWSREHDEAIAAHSCVLPVYHRCVTAIKQFNHPTLSVLSWLTKIKV